MDDRERSARRRLQCLARGAAMTNGQRRLRDRVFDPPRPGDDEERRHVAAVLATIEATEEAIYNSLFKATDVRHIRALPIDTC